MNDEKPAGAAETPAKSPSSDKPETFQDRFNAALETWRKEGCAHVMEGAEGVHACGARPHRAKMSKPDAAGNVTMSVDCVAGHADVWSFVVPAAEMKADLERQAKAAAEAQGAAGGEKDSMKASLKITMDLRTQAVNIEPWVPTPGVGIQLAGILMSHFFAILQEGAKAAQTSSGLALPPEKKILDRTGKPLGMN